MSLRTKHVLMALTAVLAIGTRTSVVEAKLASVSLEVQSMVLSR